MNRQMRLRPDPLLRLPLPRSGSPRPLRRGDRIRRLRIRRQLHFIKVLAELDEHEARLVVCELLAEADPRASVEGEEDEGVGREVLVQTGVKEAVWVEFLGWR